MNNKILFYYILQYILVIDNSSRSQVFYKLKSVKFLYPYHKNFY